MTNVNTSATAPGPGTAGTAARPVPSRLNLGQLHQLLTDAGRPAGPPPITQAPVLSGAGVEVDRTINAVGLFALAGRQHPVGCCRSPGFKARRPEPPDMPASQKAQMAMRIASPGPHPDGMVEACTPAASPSRVPLKGNSDEYH